MTPEATILTVNAIFLAFAYLWVYPNLTEKTLPVLLGYDAAINAAAFTVAGLLFWGSGTGFNMILFTGNWLVFCVLTMTCMELPLFLWFAKKHNLTL